MKIFGTDMQVTKLGGFNFSAARPDKLGAAEYTLVTVVMDVTGSISSFASDLLDMKRSVVDACGKNPRRDFLMLRNLEFNTSIREVNGFVEWRNIDPATFQVPSCTGGTALFDATFNAVAATNEYAKILSDQDFGVNGVVFVITDGDDNASSYTEDMVAKEIERGVTSEYLESLNVILIGVNAAMYRPQLESFKKKAKLTQYVDVADATSKELAKLADFVSRSISSQSQALGTGGASQALVF